MKKAKRAYLNQRFKPELDLFFENHSEALNVPSLKLFKQWVAIALKQHYSKASVSIILCDEPEAKDYNAHYRHKDYATNVLSFALNEGEQVLFSSTKILTGDLIICPEVVEREAMEQGKHLSAHYAHLTIHGVLHLCGYDHIEENEANIMEKLEISLLNQLGYENPYQ